MTPSGGSDSHPRNTRNLRDRLSAWTEAKGIGSIALSVENLGGANYGQVKAHAGDGITGYGHTSNEALNNLANGLVEDGWPDDRSEQ
jgi:hypothetical protein